MRILSLLLKTIRVSTLKALRIQRTQLCLYMETLGLILFCKTQKTKTIHIIHHLCFSLEGSLLFEVHLNDAYYGKIFGLDDRLIYHFCSMTMRDSFCNIVSYKHKLQGWAGIVAERGGRLLGGMLVIFKGVDIGWYCSAQQLYAEISTITVQHDYESCFAIHIHHLYALKVYIQILELSLSKLIDPLGTVFLAVATYLPNFFRRFLWIVDTYCILWLQAFSTKPFYNHGEQILCCVSFAHCLLAALSRSLYHAQVSKFIWRLFGILPFTWNLSSLGQMLHMLKLNLNLRQKINFINMYFTTENYL